jgi:hypothetical protein
MWLLFNFGLDCNRAGFAESLSGNSDVCCFLENLPVVAKASNEPFFKEVEVGQAGEV